MDEPHTIHWLPCMHAAAHPRTSPYRYQPSPPNTKFFEPTGQWCPGQTPGCWCYGQQPSWSAYRDPSFGYGMLTFESTRQATWTWTRNQAPAFSIGDQVRILRNV